MNWLFRELKEDCRRTLSARKEDSEETNVVEVYSEIYSFLSYV